MNANVGKEIMDHLGELINGASEQAHNPSIPVVPAVPNLVQKVAEQYVRANASTSATLREVAAQMQLVVNELLDRAAHLDNQFTSVPDALVSAVQFERECSDMAQRYLMVKLNKG